MRDRCPPPVELLQELPGLDFLLPEELIARYPPERRDGGRLLRVLPDSLEDLRITDLPSLLREGDLVVLNDTRVLPARLFARRGSGAQVEALLVPSPDPDGPCLALLRPGRRLRVGERLQVLGGGEIHLEERREDGSWRVQVHPSPSEVMSRSGQVPLPPYLGRPAEEADRERYQTVYAGPAGAVAAPTAGLHLSHELLASLEARGIGRVQITLHVGPGTFRPLRVEDLRAGRLHAEAYEIGAEAVARIEATRAAGGRVLAVGTTAVRALEGAVDAEGRLQAGRGWTDLLLRPGSRFRVVDRLLTNFHLPQSSLLALVHAFAGSPRAQAAYAHALAGRYRFYSYGDAMLLDLDPPRGE